MEISSDSENDQFDSIIREISVGNPELANSSTFFDTLSKFLQLDEVEYFTKMCYALLRAQTSSNVTFEGFKSIARTLISSALTDMPGNVNLSDVLIEKLTDFTESRDLQTTFLKQNTDFFESFKIMKDGQEIGRGIEIRRLAQIILKNRSIVNSILREVEEKNKGHPAKWEKYVTELNCCPERREILLGSLRILIAADDFSITNFKSKYLAIYCSFTNIPIEERLKRKDVFLVGIANREKMASCNATLNDVLEPLVTELEQLLSKGIDIDIHSDDGTNKFTEKKNIKVSLSAVVSDNLGELELLGLRRAFYLGFICRHCGCNYEQTQTMTSANFPLLGSEADIKMYHEDLAHTLEINNLLAAHEESRGKPLTAKSRREFYKRNMTKLGYVDHLGIVAKCAFMRLPNVHLWLITPPDTLHDLAGSPSS